MERRKVSQDRRGIRRSKKKYMGTDTGDDKQLPDITPVCISEEGDNLTI